MKLYGLIGYPLGHSFSKDFFSQKFKNEQIKNTEYKNFPISNINVFPKLWLNQPDLLGINVTIPYKQTVIPFLNEIDSKAEEIQAVNVIKKYSNGYLKGFNSDYIGFKKTLLSLLENNRPKSLILGTGGAAKAVQVVLRNLDIAFISVSRKKNFDSSKNKVLTYKELTPEHIEEYKLIINTTPLGMYPKIENLPLLPYETLSKNHFLYDLVYNPKVTSFLKKGIAIGAKTINGLDMLHEQAEAAWKIWNT